MDKVKDAPEGATHYNEGNTCYYKITEDGCMIYSKSEDKWTKSNYAWKAIPKQESTSTPLPVDIWKNAPEGAEWYLGNNRSYYRSFDGYLEIFLKDSNVWRTSLIDHTEFLSDVTLITRPPRTSVSESIDVPDDPYVNWDVAPEGCNAIHKSYLNGDGVSCENGGWER